MRKNILNIIIIIICNMRIDKNTIFYIIKKKLIIKLILKKKFKLLKWILFIIKKVYKFDFYYLIKI